MPEIASLNYDPILTKISLSYAAPDLLIWDKVLPVIEVPSRTPRIRQYDKDSSYRVANDRTGVRGSVNEVDFKVTEVPIALEDSALDEPVSVIEAEEAAAEGSLFPLQSEATEFVTWQLQLAQEVRVANIVTNAANYPTGNKTTLSGTGQWNDKVNSDPIANIQAAIDACFLPPDLFAMGQEVYSALRQHPKILDAVKGRTGVEPRGGMVSASDIADLFGVRAAYVGAARVNTAKEGQTASYSRAWGKAFAALRIPLNPGRRTILWGATFSKTKRAAYTWFDPKRGARGSDMVRVAWDRQEKVVASDVGYLYSAAVA